MSLTQKSDKKRRFAEVSKIVLDAWALLALIFKEEPAAKKVRDLLLQNSPKSPIYISWINLGEVYYTIARKKGLNAANEFSKILKSYRYVPRCLQNQISFPLQR